MVLRSKSRWLLGLVVCALTAMSYAQWSNPSEDVPAYHPSAPLKMSALPAILHGTQLSGPNFRYAWQVHVYQDAAKIGKVLYQLPCYCRCDRELGHTSLRSCYEGLHATECSTCAKEGFYAYQKTRAGWSPAKIRAGIEHQDFESINLEQQ
ncbi:MAG: PCYCGC motif-containing (lipo)protein [Acidobacteriota bacterium]